LLSANGSKKQTKEFWARLCSVEVKSEQKRKAEGCCESKGRELWSRACPHAGGTDRGPAGTWVGEAESGKVFKKKNKLAGKREGEGRVGGNYRRS